MGGCPTTTSGLQMSALNTLNTGIVSPATASAYLSNSGYQHPQVVATPQYFHGSNSSNSLNHSSSISSTTPSSPLSSPMSYGSGSPGLSKTMNDSSQSLHDETLISSSNERNVPPRSKKAPPAKPQPSTVGGKAPMPPPRKTLSSQSLFSLAQSSHGDLVPLESPSLSLPAGTKIVSTSATGTPTGLLSSASALQLQQLLDSGSTRQQQSHQPAAPRSGSSRQSSPGAATGEGSVSSSSANIVTTGPGGGLELHLSQSTGRPGLVSSASAGGLSLGSDLGSTGGGTSTPGTDHDTYSTDSSTVDEDVKRRRRKLHFPFGKRFSKSKKTQ
ncbi:mediator of RNA polymerase II transcription subunit 1-like [Uranotaenia lowii]|uniref:mediator of RNA polymerase II transcription subunit 1-like n=1 Tax=Uranotaenia lowii TaxID=190385 RepID=UPI00247893AE|nr:mediator of RNA polymerase II transcription subunit 1-like [Uranotaenia lowii]